MSISFLCLFHKKEKNIFMLMDLLLWIRRCSLKRDSYLVLSSLSISYLTVNLFLFFRDKTGKFPDYPDDDEGGSAAIFKEKDPLEVILDICNTVIPVFVELTHILINTSWTASHTLLITTIYI